MMTLILMRALRQSEPRITIWLDVFTPSDKRAVTITIGGNP